MNKNRQPPCHNDHDLVERMGVTLYGDNSGNKGMEEKMNEMHEFFMGAKFTGKVLMAIITGLGLIALSFTQIGTFIKHIFYQQ